MNKKRKNVFFTIKNSFLWSVHRGGVGVIGLPILRKKDSLSLSASLPVCLSSGALGGVYLISKYSEEAQTTFSFFRDIGSPITPTPPPMNK